jgi:RNA polymerase-binding transcription factor DksA
MGRIAARSLMKVRNRLEVEQACKLRKAGMLSRSRSVPENPPDPVGGDEADLALASAAGQLEDLELRRISLSVRTIERALLTMEHGQYGVCLGCEEPIPIRRLQAVPSAVLCRVCQEEAEAVRAAWTA